MAAHTGVRSCHFTATAATADTVTLTDNEIIGFDVIMRSGTGPIWFLWATGVAPATVTAAVDEAEMVLAAGEVAKRRVLFKGGRPLGEGQTLHLSTLTATADPMSVIGIYCE